MSTASAATWQAAWFAGAEFQQLRSVVRQRSSASGQRGWKRQPPAGPPRWAPRRAVPVTGTAGPGPAPGQRHAGSVRTGAAARPTPRVPAAGGDRGGGARHSANDGNAHHAFGGVAGHAGLFGTAAEAARLGAVMLGGQPDWPPAVVAEFAAAGPDPVQAPGWRRTQVSTASGSVTVLGHPGFTGTEVSVAPSLGLSRALLTNRLHPTSTPVEVSALRDRVARHVRLVPYSAY